MSRLYFKPRMKPFCELNWDGAIRKTFFAEPDLRPLKEYTILF